MNLNELSCNAYFTARLREKNGGVKCKDILKHMAGEVIEAAEAREIWGAQTYDEGAEKDAYAEELADVLICVLIAAARDEVNLDEAVNLKMRKNAERAALEGDKK